MVSIIVLIGLYNISIWEFIPHTIKRMVIWNQAFRSSSSCIAAYLKVNLLVLNIACLWLLLHDAVLQECSLCVRNAAGGGYRMASASNASFLPSSALAYMLHRSQTECHHSVGHVVLVLGKKVFHCLLLFGHYSICLIDCQVFLLKIIQTNLSTGWQYTWRERLNLDLTINTSTCDGFVCFIATVTFDLIFPLSY